MKKWLKYFVALATVLTFIVNILSGAGVINNVTPQALSDAYPVLFVPAGYVFSIWGVIYIGMIAYTIYQFRHDEEDIVSTRVIFIVSCLANISWIFLWHFRHPIWSVLAMLILLLSLITLYLQLKIGTAEVTRVRKWMVNIPFSIYLGWISVATIANITVALYVLNWNGFGIAPEVWSAILLIIATALGILMLFRKNDTAYALVLIWSIFGISVKFMNNGTISFISLICSLILLGLVVYKYLTKKVVVV